MSWYVQVCTGMYLHILLHDWYESVQTRMYEYVLEHTSIFHKFWFSISEPDSTYVHVYFRSDSSVIGHTYGTFLCQERSYPTHILYYGVLGAGTFPGNLIQGKFYQGKVFQVIFSFCFSRENVI